MSPWTSNLVAQITPAGRGAVATIAVVGPDVLAIVARRFAPASGKSLADFSPGRIALGRFRGLAAEEELVVGVVASDHLEVHCHGGSAAVDAVVAALVEEGCRPTTWQEFTQQLEADPLAAEARIALAAARTERIAAILLSQYEGALRRAVQTIWTDVERGDLPQAARALDELLRYACVGLHLTQPWKVVLAGRPNVGKSSLINALVGYRRSIVFDQPGTTRDIVTATTAIDGWPIELSDTAGLREAREAVELAGVERARQELAAADLVLLIYDAPTPWSSDDELLLAQLPLGKPRLVIYNKCDLGPPVEHGRPNGMAVSATQGTGLDALLAEIGATLVPAAPPPGAAVPFTARQIAALTAAQQALELGNIAEASLQLASLSGVL